MEVGNILVGHCCWRCSSFCCWLELARGITSSFKQVSLSRGEIGGAGEAGEAGDAGEKG